VNGNYGFASFQSGALSFLGSLPASAISSSALSNLILGSDCQLLNIGQSFYSISSSIGQGSLVEVARPASWTLQAGSNNGQYVIASNSLYKYSSSGYSSLIALKTYQSYRLINSDNRLIVIGSNSSLSTTYTVTQTVYVLTEAAGTVTIIGMIELSGSSISSFIPVHASQQLTKLHYEYNSLVNGSKVIVFKNVDYSVNLVSSIELKSMDHYLETTQYMTAFTSQNYFLDEYYMVVRNDSSLTSTATGTFIE
jgi:hypothetical protein